MEKKDNEKYICKKCKRIKLPKEIIKSFNVCPTCGELLDDNRKIVQKFLDLIIINERFSKCYDLIKKSEFISAIREACVILEDTIKKISGIEAHGADLAAKAFSYKFDSNTNSFIQKPAIQINTLSNQTLRNEQEGIKFLTMGIFKGIRNIYMHSHGSNKFRYCLKITIMIEFVHEQITTTYGTVADDTKDYIKI